MRSSRWAFLLVALSLAAVMTACEAVETITSRLTPPPTYTLYPTYTAYPTPMAPSAPTAANVAETVQDPAPATVAPTEDPAQTPAIATGTATAAADLPVGAETPEPTPEANLEASSALPTPTPQAINVLRLEMTSGNVGDRVGVSLFLEKAQDVAALQLDVKFDPGVLEGLTADSFGAMTQDHQLSHRIDNESGSIRMILISLTGSVMTGTGEIALNSFNVLAPGLSPLELSGVLLSDVSAQPITRFTTVDGLVEGR